MLTGLFYIQDMATRITTLKPACALNPGGIQSVSVLDYDDFLGFGFAGGALYDSCLVTEIHRAGVFAEVQADAAKYSGPISTPSTAGIVTHTLDTFIESMEASYIAALHLAAKHRYIVLFTGMNGRNYVFGYEAGAVPTYSAQTDGATGFTITFSAPSIYPLFEVTDAAINQNISTIKWLPDFIYGAYCEVQ